MAPVPDPSGASDGPEVDQGAALFELIAGLNARFRTIDTRLPGEKPRVEVWAGVLFSIGSNLLLAPLDHIAEVLEPTAEITAVPGTKPWVLGVVNNRGVLLPLFDLAALIHGGTPLRRDTDRVLAVRQAGPPCGLLVSKAIGIRHFETTTRMAEIPDGLGVLGPFAESAFPLDGKSVPVMALNRLLESPLLNAGAA